MGGGCGKYDFAAAKLAIYEPKLKTVKSQKEQESLGAKAANLERFKFYLVFEIGAKGSDKPLTLKDGTTVGGIVSADDARLQVRDQGAVKAIPWSAVAPESLYALAKSLINPAETADAAAARKWHLGNFAVHIGKLDEGRAYMEEAAKENPGYGDEMPLILGTPAAQ